MIDDASAANYNTFEGGFTIYSGKVENCFRGVLNLRRAAACVSYWDLRIGLRIGLLYANSQRIGLAYRAAYQYAAYLRIAYPPG